MGSRIYIKGGDRGPMKLSRLQITKARATIAAHYKVGIARVLWNRENCFIVMVRDGKTRVIRYDPTSESILSEKVFYSN